MPSKRLLLLTGTKDNPCFLYCPKWDSVMRRSSPEFLRLTISSEKKSDSMEEIRLPLGYLLASFSHTVKLGSLCAAPLAPPVFQLSPYLMGLGHSVCPANICSWILLVVCKAQAKTGWRVMSGQGATESYPKAKFTARVLWEVMEDFSQSLMTSRPGVRNASREKHLMDMAI